MYSSPSLEWTLFALQIPKPLRQRPSQRPRRKHRQPWRRAAFRSIRSERLRSRATHWAPFFAAGRDGEACRYQTQPLCERIACMRAGGIAISNCEPPSSAFRRLFKDAAVEEVEIRGWEAGAWSWTGQDVSLLSPAWRGAVWLIHSSGTEPESGWKRPLALQGCLGPLCGISPLPVRDAGQPGRVRVRSTSACAPI